MRRRVVREQKLGIQFRTGTIELRAEGDGGSRTVEFSLSSEHPVERYSYFDGPWLEVLGHKRTEVRLDALNDHAPYLKDHDPRQQVGVIERAWLDTATRKSRVRARFGRSTLASEELQDVEDGIRTKVSVGYLIHELTLIKKSDDGPDEYRATDWEPVEASNVAMPADPTVGHGREFFEALGLGERADEFANHRTRIVEEIDDDTASRGEVMDRIQVIRSEDGVVLWIKKDEFDAAKHERMPEPPAAPPTPEKPTPDAPPPRAARSTNTEEPDTLTREQAEQLADERIEKRLRRDSEIRALGAKYNATDKAEEALRAGLSLEAFKAKLWDEGHTATPGSTAGAGSRGDYPSLDGVPTDLGLPAKDLARYSILNASYGVADNEFRGLERECSDEIAKRLGRKARPGAFFVPRDVLAASVIPSGQRSDAERTLQLLREITTGGSGGNLVATDLLDGSFIDVLRNQSVVMQMGATMISGLVENVDIPRQATAAVGEWLAEGGSVTDSDLTLDLVSFRPKTIGRKTQVTRRMQMQSTPAIEGLVRSDLSFAVALGLDSGALNGTGAGNQPTGIRNMAGVTTVVLGAPDGGPATWASQVSLEKEILAANVPMVGIGYVMTPSARAHMMVTTRIAGGTDSTFILPEPGNSLLGHQLAASNQLPSNLTKGAGTGLSSEICGAWPQLIIGEWGVMEIKPDPYTAGDADALILRVFQDADVQARHEEAFAIIEDMDTTGV